MIQVEFQTDGKVRVFAHQNGDSISVTGPVNKLADMLPASLFNQVRERMAEFLDLTTQTVGVRRIGR